MDLSIYNTNTTDYDNPPGPLVTMDPSSYIPNTADPTVPLPPGLLVSTIEGSIQTTHPINLSTPLVVEDFPPSEAGFVLHTAFIRISEFFSHGFTVTGENTPDRDTWLTATAQILIDIHNSIRRTNLQPPPSNSFSDLNQAEVHHVCLIKSTLSTLNTFFTSHLSNPDSAITCLRCLEECNMPVTHENWQSILMSCDQNLRAAHSTIVNDAIRHMTNQLTEWADTRSSEIKDKLIDALTSEAADQKILDDDPRVQAWANTNLEFIRTRLHNIITKTAATPDAFTRQWVSEAADAAYMIAARSSTAQAEEAASRHYDKEMERLLKEADVRIASDMAEYQTRVDDDFSKFKHQLRVDTEKRKDNASKTADAAVRKVSRTHPHAPIIAASTSRRGHGNQPNEDIRPSRTPSRASSTHPSRNASPVRAQSTTPKASPATFFPPSQALTEPLTDISVGPPSNSFEEAMLEVHASLASVSTSVGAQIVPTVVAPIPDAFTSFFSQISSQISTLGQKFDTIETRLSQLEQPQKSYTPSAPAPPFMYTDYDANIAPPDEDMAEDMSDYAPLTAQQLYIEEQDHISLFLEKVYRTHYGIKDPSLPPVHANILNSEFHSSFDIWIELFQITKEVDDLTTNDIDAFLSWRIKHIDLMADTPSDLQDIWIRKRDNIRAATGQGTEGTTRSRPPRPQSPNGWFDVQKGGKVKSYATIASQPSPKPSQPMSRPSPTPSTVPAKPGSHLTRPQIETMTKQQIISLLGTLFSVTVRNTRATKLSLVNLLLSSQSKANPVDLTSPTPSPPTPQTPASTTNVSRPRARPANQAARLNTEFTILAHPDEVATRAKKLDPAAIIRTLRTAINQTHGGGPAQITLLSGRWSSRLSHNFVLTFAGKPTNDQVYKYRSILTSPFGSAARIIPQDGFTKIVIHSVPVERDQNGNPAATTALINELRRNPVCEGLTYVNPPQWFSRDIPLEKRNSSITVAFIDQDGSRLQQLINDPPSLFGGLTRVEKYNPLPVLRGCERCHALDHSIAKCSFKKGATICPLCGGGHKARDHDVRCAGVPHNGSLTCTCPERCINCGRAGKAGKGHTAISHTCPLRKLYRKANIRAGDPSDEEGPTITRMVEDLVPSSQPTADGVASSPPTITSPAQVDDAPTPSPPIAVATSTIEFAAMLNVTEPQLMTTPDLWAKYLIHIGLKPIDATPSIPQ